MSISVAPSNDIYWGSTWTNNETGEVKTYAELNKAHEEATRKESGEKEFYKLYKKKFEKLTYGLSGSGCAILNHMMARMTRENIFKAEVEAIAKETGISRSSVTRAIAELKERDIIRRNSKSEIMVNPTVIMYGRGKKLIELCTKYIEL